MDMSGLGARILIILDSQLVRDVEQNSGDLLMGLQLWYCKYCKHEFGWCSVGSFTSWGEHSKTCDRGTDENWRVDT